MTKCNYKTQIGNVLWLPDKLENVNANEIYERSLHKFWLGIFRIKLLFLGHKTQGFCFYYIWNIWSKSNKLMWEILDISNYDNFHDGDFSHPQKYLGKNFKT
jgi:hypothetical protein